MLGVGRGGPLGASQRASGPGGAEAAKHAVTGASPTGGGGDRGRADRGRSGGAVPRSPTGRLTEAEAWTALAAVDGMGPVTFGAVLLAFGSARAVLAVGGSARGRARLLAAAAAAGLRMPDEVAAGIGAARDGWPALRARLAALDLVAVTAEDPAYPRRLRTIELPPPVLFARGALDVLEDERVVAIVGTRRPTDDGRRSAATLAGTVAAAGAVVVSGLAVGIDGAAHAAAVAAGGLSVAVLGSGHARIYPAVHASLAAEIVRRGGLVVAEVPPDTPPSLAGFPRRNRIIAGLADATVVVEAGERSGALITASWALEQGRALFVVPGPIDRPQSVGCNRLLRASGGEVRIVAGADELIEDLGYGAPIAVRARRRDRAVARKPDPGAVVARLGPAEGAAVRALLGGPTTADGVAAATDLAPAAVLAVLTRLEAEGLVRAAFGRYRLAGALEGVRAVPVRPGGREVHP